MYYDDFFGNEFGELGFGYNPARQTLADGGFDRHTYISTAQLGASPYVTNSLIQARIGGLLRLIESVDDMQPPEGSIGVGTQALATLNSVIQNVTTEINGYLSSIYPIPLAQTGTVAVLQVTGLSTDGLNAVTGLAVPESGNYLTAPGASQNPVYLRYIDPLADERLWNTIYGTPNFCMGGTGLHVTVAYSTATVTDESGNAILVSQISGTPSIVAGGINYNLNDLLVLTGGTSVVPAKIREAALVLICHSLYQRRLSAEEKNPFSFLAKYWREFLRDIGEGEKQLDGTYKRFFSAGAVWGQRSVLFGANSL